MPGHFSLSYYSFLVAVCALIAPLKASDVTSMQVMLGIRISLITAVLQQDQAPKNATTILPKQCTVLPPKITKKNLTSAPQPRYSHRRDSYTRHKGTQQR